MNIIKQINTSFKNRSQSRPKPPIATSSSASAFQAKHVWSNNADTELTRTATGGVKATYGQQDVQRLSQVPSQIPRPPQKRLGSHQSRQQPMQQRQKSPNQVTIANQHANVGKPPQPGKLYKRVVEAEQQIKRNVDNKKQTGEAPTREKKETRVKIEPKSESGDEEESEEEEEESEQSEENEVGDVGGFFSAQPTTSQKLITERQVTKLEFMRHENEQLRQQVMDLKTNLHINKQLLMTSESQQYHSNPAPDKVQQKLSVYQKREDELMKQLAELRESRDEAQANVLIQKQMLVDLKVQQIETVKDQETEIEELKVKLDKTEYIMQYKEKIWTYLEREIRKVVHQDSDLMKKVQQQTKILTDCLAETKVSNVVNQNTSLLADHSKVCKRLRKIIDQLNKDLMTSEITSGYNGMNQKYSDFKRKSLNAIQQSIDFETHPSRLEDKNLSQLVVELEKLVEATLTRLSLAEEESSHFKTECQDTVHQYQRMKTQFELLSNRIKQEQTMDHSSMNQRKSPDVRTEFSKRAGEQFSMASAAAFASVKSSDNGGKSFRQKIENFMNSNSTKTGGSSSGGQKPSDKVSPRQPPGTKKLTFEEPILMPTQSGLTVHQRLIRESKNSQLLFDKPFIAEGRSPRENPGGPGEQRLNFEDLRISVIAPSNQDDNKMLGTPDLTSPKPTREIKLSKGDDLDGMISTIKGRQRRRDIRKSKADSFDQFEDKMDQSPFFEGIDDL